VPGGAHAKERLLLVLTDLMVLDPPLESYGLKKIAKYVLKTRDIPPLINTSPSHYPQDQCFGSTSTLRDRPDVAERECAM
jgi:hypothetical protein